MRNSNFPCTSARLLLCTPRGLAFPLLPKRTSAHETRSSRIVPPIHYIVLGLEPGEGAKATTGPPDALAIVNIGRVFNSYAYSGPRFKALPEDGLVPYVEKVKDLQRQIAYWESAL